MKHFFYRDWKNLQSDDKNGSSYQKSKFWAFDETKKENKIIFIKSQNILCVPNR